MRPVSREGDRRPVHSCEEKEHPPPDQRTATCFSFFHRTSFCGKSKASQAWRQRPVIVALGRLRQEEGCELSGLRG